MSARGEDRRHAGRGNTVIVKAAEQAPLSALKMAELIAGFSAGCVGTLLAGGKACGQALCTHPLVRKSHADRQRCPRAVPSLRAAADTLKAGPARAGGKNDAHRLSDADAPRWPTVSCAG